jgi:hypothetical protein
MWTSKIVLSGWFSGRLGKAGYDGHFGAEIATGAFVLLPNSSAISVCAAQVLRN